jgi:hypothetical protein
MAMVQSLETGKNELISRFYTPSHPFLSSLFSQQRCELLPPACPVICLLIFDSSPSYTRNCILFEDKDETHVQAFHKCL